MEGTNVNNIVNVESFTSIEAKAHNGSWARIVTPLRTGRRPWNHTRTNILSSSFVREFEMAFILDLTIIKLNVGKAQESVQEHRDAVEQYIRTVCEARRLLDPLEKNSYPQVRVSPLRIIPKSEPGKWCLSVFSLW